MLLKSAITNIEVHSKEWFDERLAKFTSSEWHFVMGAAGIGVTGMKYIYRKVGEEMTGIPCRDEITTDATAHGHTYEPLALTAFAKKMNIEFLVTQKLIVPKNSRHGSTPDGLIVYKESTDHTGYDVFTVEAKCPTSYDGYLELWECETPMAIKAVSKKYYWQVLHQMDVAGALKGYLVIYQPYFKAGGLKIIEFRKSELINEFKLINERKKEVEQIFITLRDKLLAA